MGSKRGRPKLNRPAVDRGPWFQQVRRAALAGAHGPAIEHIAGELLKGNPMTAAEAVAFDSHLRNECAKTDGTLTEYPLGILFANDVITQDQRNAGDEYARTCAMAIGRKRELGFDIEGKDDIHDDTLEVIEREWRAYQSALRKLGGKVARITEQVCVYRRMNPYMVPRKDSTAGNDDRHWLLLGLNELVKIQSGKKRAA